MVTKEDIEFLRKEKWRTTQDKDGNFHANPTMEKTLKKSIEEINNDSGAKMFIEGWVKRIKQKQSQKMVGFVWDEKDVISNKVFPMDVADGVFFYGLHLPKNVDNEVKGKKIGKKQVWSSCLITSDRKILEVNERLKEDFGIDFENIPTSLPKRWDLDKVKKYLAWEDEKIDKNKLIEKIINQYSKYLFIRNKTWYKIHALWDLGTYLYQIFEAYPFIELRGIAGTGKTKSMTISSYMTFNGGQIMVNPSEATLFRETDEVRGCKYFDEAEKLWIYNKSTRQYEGDVRTELINASYTKEGKVPRQEKILNKFVTKWYSPYSPTMLGSINGLFGATEQRAITRITTKSSNEDERGELEPSEDRGKKIWAEIRDECYRFALYNWKEIKQLYNNFPKEIGLKRRDYQIWKPILTLAKYISEDLFKEVVGFAKELTNRRIDDLVPESSFDYMCLESLRNCIRREESSKIYVDFIKYEFCNIKGDEEGKKDIYLNRNISNHLDKIGFKDLRKRDKKASYFDVDESVFNEIVAPICPNLVDLSTSSTSSTPLHIKEENKGGDEVVMGVDSKNKKVVMVAIDGENVDGKKDGNNEFEKLKQQYQKEGLI